MEDGRFYSLVNDLNQGANIADTAKTEAERSQGYRQIRQAGEELNKAGGKPMLSRALDCADERHQRRIELEWFGLEDDEGNIWLP